MKTSLLASVLLTVLGSLIVAQAQSVPDRRIEDLVRLGRVRVALFPPMHARDPKTGDFTGFAMDLTRTLATSLGIQGVRPSEFEFQSADRFTKDLL